MPSMNNLNSHKVVEKWSTNKIRNTTRFRLNWVKIKFHKKWRFFIIIALTGRKWTKKYFPIHRQWSQQVSSTEENMKSLWRSGVYSFFLLGILIDVLQTKLKWMLFKINWNSINFFFLAPNGYLLPCQIWLMLLLIAVFQRIINTEWEWDINARFSANKF